MRKSFYFSSFKKGFQPRISQKPFHRLLCHHIFQFLSGNKFGNLLSIDFDGFARLGISRCSGSSFYYRESAKTNERNLVSLFQRSRNCIQDTVDCFFRCRLLTNDLCNRANQISLFIPFPPKFLLLPNTSPLTSAPHTTARSYHNYSENNINDNELKSSIIVKGDVLLITGSSRALSSLPPASER